MPAPPTCLVVFHRPGPLWKAELPVFEQPGLQAHIDHYRGLLQAGKLGAGGPFMDGAGGGMMIARPDMPADELRAFAERDPAVLSGLLKVEIRPWVPAMRNDAGIA